MGEREVMNTKPKGGTEILHEQLVSQLSKEDLEGVNIIRSICHPDLIEKDKINILWQHLNIDQPNAALMADRRFVDQIDYFIYVSHWQFNQFREKFRIPEYKSFVLKNATHHYDSFAKIPPGTDKIKIIYPTTPWRGLSVLLLAVDYLNKTRDDFEVHIYSSTEIYGKAFNEKEGDKYEGLFARCKNTKNMIYHGYAPNEKVKEAVMESHIFAYPSIFEETSCLSAIEAMMAGCHVVTTNYGALPETCAEFATMIEFEPNLKALAERFASALDSVLTKYRAGGYKQDMHMQMDYYNNYYSWNTRINEWRNFLSYVKRNKEKS